MQRLLFFLLLLAIYSCVPKEEKSYTNIELSINNQEVRKLIGFQDKQLFDSLYAYLHHIDPSLRFLAAKAFSSQYEANSNDSLSLILSDSLIQNKAIAAYSLGQSYNPKTTLALTNAFIQADSIISVNNELNKNILEAIGKTGNKDLLKLIASVKYLPSDNKLLLGQARGIYRFALRGITNKIATEKMVNYAIESHFGNEIRIIASEYLSRAKDIDLTKYKYRLIQRFNKEDNVFIKANLATAIGNTKDTEVMRIFINELNQNLDYRVKINMLKSLSHFPYINIIEPILLKLNDKNIMVAQTAADMLIKHGNKYDAAIYQQYISKKNHFSVNAKIYKAVLQHVSPNSKRRINVKNKILNAIQSAESDEEKTAYIHVLGNLPKHYKIIINLLATTETPVKTAVFESLIEVYKSHTKSFSYTSKKAKKEILHQVKQEMKTKDAAIVALGAALIANPDLGVKTFLGDDIQWLDTLINKLTLPKEIESYIELSKAIAHVKGVQYKAIKPEFQHPITWDQLNDISDSTRCIIHTNKGSITLKLFIMDAPGSVANFVQLVKSGFYKDKYFHRVVPNFVIQAGCPRGDGYGSLDYSIRSELGDRYFDDEGYIGMASAGKNTESTQWFITHRPTPHLDGKYTIFGKVTKGMDVVHQILQGDIINSIEIQNL